MHCVKVTLTHPGSHCPQTAWLINTAGAAARYPAEARSRRGTTVPAISLNSQIGNIEGTVYCGNGVGDR